MKNYLIFFIFISVSAKSIAQYSLLAAIPVKKESFFTTDNLQNCYVISNHEIYRYTPMGVLFNRYSNLLLGNITLVDATNPMKVFLFYRDFSKIQFLDNMMSERGGVISLLQLGLEQSTLACTSFDNGFWVYDQISFSLIRFNQSFGKAQEARNINQNIGYEPQPNFMVESGDWLYLNNPQTGILVFDIFGTYFKTIPIKGLEKIQFAGQNLYYFKDKKLFSYHLKTLDEQEIQLPSGDLQSLRVEKERLVVLTNDTLKIYKAE